MGHGPHDKLNTSTVSPVLEQQFSRLPPDVSGQIERWLQDTLALTESFGLQSVTVDLKRLEERRKLPGFRLAFVGEFNRGKSTLINRLLDRPILPVKAIPTTSTITYLVAGESEEITVHFQDGRQEVRPLEADSWSDLIASDDSQVDQLQEIFPEVRVTLNNAWLQDTDAGFIDTPGAGDINDHRTALISDVLSQSDATVMLVSAVMPLSLTERAFLQQEILGRHIPLILVVVSKLDTLPYDQRPTVLRTIHERLMSISPQIPMISSYPPIEEITENSALEAVRTQINSLVAQSDRRLWRSRQIAGTLADHLGQLAQIGQQALVAARADSAQRDEERKKVHKEGEIAASKWETIRLQLESRRLTVDQELRRRLNTAADSLSAALSSALDEAPDPRFWWNKEFSLLLRRELLLLARASESFVLDALAHEVQALQEAVARAFDTQPTQSAISHYVPLEPTLQVQDITLTDIQQYRLLSLIGSSIGIVAGFLLLGPIGSAISAALGLMGDYIQGQRIEEQRQQLKVEITRCVDRTLEEYTRLLTQRLHDLYDELEQRMRQEQASWQAAKEEALAEGGNTPTAQPAWQELSEKSLALQSEITMALAQ